MLTVRDLPRPSLLYDIFRARMAQIKLLFHRGYLIPDKLKYLLDDDTLIKVKFNVMLESMGKNRKKYVEGESWRFNDIFELEFDMDGKYPESLICVICEGRQAHSVVSNIINDLQKEKKGRNKHDIQVIVTKPTNALKDLMTENVVIEVIPMQKIYTDVLSHKLTSRMELVDDNVAYSILNSPNMIGRTFPSILQTDPVSIAMGLKKGNLIRIYNNMVYTGQTISRVTYRIVV